MSIFAEYDFQRLLVTIIFFIFVFFSIRKVGRTIATKNAMYVVKKSVAMKKEVKEEQKVQ